MDFVTAWKASSIILTGAFGVLGLMKEYKDKITNRITIWGRVSLAGILVSSLCGLAAQIEETSAQEKARVGTAQQTLALLERTDRAVKDIQRTLSPLDQPQITFNFEADCREPILATYCKGIKRRSPKSGLLVDGSWPLLKQFGADSLGLSVDLFGSPREAERFVRGEVDRGNITIGAMASGPVIHSQMLDENRSRDIPGGLVLSAPNAKIFSFENDGKMRALQDIPGSTLVLSDYYGVIGHLQVQSIHITFKNGQSIEAQGPFERIIIRDKTAYRYLFPKPRSEQVE